jgi:hypothetical protein
MEAVDAGAALPNEVASAIVREGDVEGLVDIPYPMPQILE